MREPVLVSPSRRPTLRRRIELALWALIASSLAACTVGPDFRRPDAPSLPRYTESELPGTTADAATPGGAAQRFNVGADIPAQWWTVFHSEPLDLLIRQALVQSPTIA